MCRDWKQDIQTKVCHAICCSSEGSTSLLFKTCYGIILAIHQKIAGIISIPRTKERRHKHWRQNRIQPTGLSLWGKEPLSNDHKTAVTIEELWYPFLSTLTLEVLCLNLNSNFLFVSSAVRSWDAHIWGNGKTVVAKNSCNLSYLIKQRQDHQKTVQLHKTIPETITSGPLCITDLF